jgi:predicted nucleic acid-binding protein
MIFVDTSVWIDFFGGRPNAQTGLLETTLKAGNACTGDLVMTELLQGIRSDRDFEWTRSYMTALPILTVSDHALAIMAARHYRLLRSRGFTIRSTIDTLIATRCIREDLSLLSSDRDFAPFFRHLGLRDAMAEVDA